MELLNMNRDKKSLERKFATILVRQLGLSDDVLLPAVEHDATPDLLANIDGRTVGIEVTEIMRRDASQEDAASQPEYVRQSEQLKVLALAREQYIGLGGRPLSVIVNFSSHPIRKQDRQEVAGWLASLIFRESTTTEGGFSWHADECIVDRNRDSVLAVSALRNKTEGFHSWSSVLCGFFDGGFESAALFALTEKEPKYPAYRMKCDECWLLLIADWERATSCFEWNGESHISLPETSFERVFFYDAFAQKIVVLKSDDKMA